MPQKIGPSPHDQAYTIKELRAFLGYTIASMSSVLGISTSTYHQWETGRRTMSLPTIQSICSAFDCAAYVTTDGVWFVDIFQHPKDEEE